MLSGGNNSKCKNRVANLERHARKIFDFLKVTNINKIIVYNNNTMIYMCVINIHKTYTYSICVHMLFLIYKTHAKYFQIIIS